MAASSSASVPARDSTSMEMKMKLISLNDELVKFEYTYSVYVANPEENEEEEEEKRRAKGKGKQKVGEIEEISEEPPQSQQRQKLISDLEEWNLKAQPYIKDEVTPFLTANVFKSYKTLKLLHRFLNYNLLSRSQALTAMILHPQQQEQEDDDEDEHDIAKTVLKKTVYAAKGMVSEIRDALAESSSKKITLAEYMKDETNNDNLPFEYGCIGNIRIRAVLAAIQLSKRVSQFMFSLSDRDEELLEKLVSEIKKLTQKAENSIIASKFVVVMDATMNAISEQKQKQKKKNKKEVTAEAMAMEERMIKDICKCICDLEFILCSENVPEAVKMVNGARVRMEVVLGLMLYQVQGIRLLVGKENHGDDHVMWYKLKSLIADLWKIQQYDEFASSIY